MKIPILLQKVCENGLLEETESPWRKLVGIYRDDPYLDEYLQAIADYRNEVEDDPRRP